MRPLLFALLLSAPAAAEVFDPAGLTALESLLEQAVAKTTPPGIVLWLERNGQSHTTAQGARALQPAREAMTLDTIFDAASLTKVVATLPCVLALAEEGKLRFDDPVVRHLPEFAGGRDILLRHLLAHTSGLPAGVPREPAWSGGDEGVRRALACLPEAPPDTRFRYSDVNFILLGEIVRRASGRSLDAYARQRIFAPLGMACTGFTPPAEWQPRIAPP
jgi:CubicO group peptidase (beta-lactamase class C family)